MQRKEEKIFCVNDVAVELIRSWKSIVLITCLILSVAMAFGVGLNLWDRRNTSDAFENSSEGSETEYQARIDKARESLTSDQAEEVERLNEQLNSYMSYRKEFEEKFNFSMKNSGELGEDLIIKRTGYQMVSSVSGAEYLLSLMSLGDQDYEKIRQLFPEMASLSDVYNYVNIWTLNGNNLNLVNMGDDTVNSPFRTLIFVEVLGNSKEICDQMEDIINTSFQKEIKNLSELDSELSLKKLESGYNRNIPQYVSEKRQQTFDYLQKIDTMIYNFRNNYIDKLSEEQKEYYNVLKDSEYGAEAVDEGSAEKQAAKLWFFSKKKLAAAFLISLLAAVCILIFRYMITGTIKVEEEIIAYYGIPVIGCFFQGNSRKGVMPWVISKLYTVDIIDGETSAQLISIDVCTMLRRTGTDSAYLIRTAKCDTDKIVSDRIRQTISEMEPTSDIREGMPFESTESLKILSEHKNALLLVHTKKTLQRDLERIVGFCNRHSIHILGAITIVEV